jgi:hypothetical protein
MKVQLNIKFAFKQLLNFFNCMNAVSPLEFDEDACCPSEHTGNMRVVRVNTLVICVLSE